MGESLHVLNRRSLRKLTELMMASVGFGASNDGGGGGSMDERLRKSTSNKQIGLHTCNVFIINHFTLCY